VTQGDDYAALDPEPDLERLARSPALHAKDAERVMRSRRRHAIAALAANPDCPRTLLRTCLLTHHPAILSNPAFAAYAMLDRDFLTFVGLRRLSKVIHHPATPEVVLRWCARNAGRDLHARAAALSAIGRNPSCPRTILEELPPSDLRAVHLNSPLAWCMPWRRMAQDLPAIIEAGPGSRLHVAEPAVVAALASHAMFPGDCLVVASMIAASGKHASLATLACHPSLTSKVAEVLRSACIPSSMVVTAPGAREETAGVLQAFHGIVRPMVDVARQWDDAETHILATRHGEDQLAPFLLCTGSACARRTLREASRSRQWRLRLAVAMNHRTPREIREHLAAADHSWVVRAAASETASGPSLRDPLPEGWVIEHAAPVSARQTIERCRRALFAKNGSGLRSAVVELTRDPLVRRHLAAGVYRVGSQSLHSSASPLLAINHAPRRRVIARMITDP